MHRLPRSLARAATIGRSSVGLSVPGPSSARPSLQISLFKQRRHFASAPLPTPPKDSKNAPLSPSERVILRAQARARIDQVKAIRESNVHLTKDKVDAVMTQFHGVFKKGREMAFEEFTVVMGALDVIDPVQIKTLFKFFDSDNSGRVSASELASGLTLALDSSPADRRLLIFRMWDRDGSGSLTKAEFTDLLVGWYSTLPTPDPTQTPERIRKNAEAFFDKLDANGDGVMTFEEFDMAVEKGGEGMEWLSSVLG